MKNISLLNKKTNQITLALTLLFPLALYGCNTIEGAGTDIKQGGKALERAAENAKECSRPCPCCRR